MLINTLQAPVGFYYLQDGHMLRSTANNSGVSRRRTNTQTQLSSQNIHQTEKLNTTVLILQKVVLTQSCYTFTPYGHSGTFSQHWTKESKIIQTNTSLLKIHYVMC